MPMIKFSRSEKKVFVNIATTMGNGWWWHLFIECSDEPYAILLKERLEADMERKIESIRRESYEQGWKDAKSKKVAKKTWFNPWW